MPADLSGSAYRQPTPVVIRQSHTAPTHLPSEKPILFDQVGQRLSLPTIEPPCDGEE
jgi:hypothetical protein